MQGAPRPGKIALRLGTPSMKGKGGGKGPPRRQLCYDFARNGTCPRGNNCPYVHAAEKRKDGQVQTLGHMGGGK